MSEIEISDLSVADIGNMPEEHRLQRVAIKATSIVHAMARNLGVRVKAETAVEPNPAEAGKNRNVIYFHLEGPSEEATREAEQFIQKFLKRHVRTAVMEPDGVSQMKLDLEELFSIFTSQYHVLLFDADKDSNLHLREKVARSGRTETGSTAPAKPLTTPVSSR